MQIEYKQFVFVTSSDADPDTMRKHGWKPRRDTWVTSRVDRAAPFLEFCLGEAHTRCNAFVSKRRADIADSVASTSDLQIPIGPRATADDKDFRGYQRAGISFMRGRHSSYNTDSRRLGKTWQAIGLCNLIPPDQWKGALIIPPSSVKINWCREWDYISTHGGDIARCEGSDNPQTKNLVCNYDIVDRHIDYIHSREWSVVVFDESGKYLRNPRSNRTIMCLGGTNKYEREIKALHHRTFLDGTPIYTRAMNLWPTVRACDPNGLGSSWWKFANRYCDPKHNGFSMEYLGTSNGEELQYKMRSSFMIGRAKSDVVEELPPNRQTIVLPKAKLGALVRKERNLVQSRLAELENMLQAERTPELADAVIRKFGHLDGGEDRDGELYDGWEAVGAIRRELAVAKIPLVVEFVNELLESEPKVVIFAHHRDVVNGLKAAYPGCAWVMGGMTDTKRQAQVDKFQTDPECRVFVGNITAAGVGIELSAADTVVFAELSWMPAELDQAEDRVWLVGKTVPIQIYRLVVEDSVESQMAELLALRQDAIERATVAKRMSTIVN